MMGIEGRVFDRNDSVEKHRTDITDSHIGLFLLNRSDFIRQRLFTYQRTVSYEADRYDRGDPRYTYDQDSEQYFFPGNMLLHVSHLQRSLL